jgi:signal transduction histidine kinase
MTQSTPNLRPNDGSVSARPAPLTDLSAARQRIIALEEELNQTKRELAEARRQLREADKLKSEFIATVSHELRTPLNSIIGFAKLLLKQKIGPLNSIQQTDISVIYDSAQHLLSLVNDILDLSKIEAGKIRLDPVWVSVEEIIVGVMASTIILIEGKPIELRDEIEPHLPKVFVDRGRIRQVVINILSNAAKFTDAGSITMRVGKISKNEQDFICFSVKDTGIGIAPEDMDKVFEAFRQIDSSVARRAEGTGLGMPISYRLISLHGGELWVESQVGHGSTFSFTIPLQPPASLLHRSA